MMFTACSLRVRDGLDGRQGRTVDQAVSGSAERNAVGLPPAVPGQG